jgi:hypothetical protein
MIEFCLSAVLWMTVLMGLSTVGLNLIRALQVEQNLPRCGTHVQRGAGLHPGRKPEPSVDAGDRVERHHYRRQWHVCVLHRGIHRYAAVYGRRTAGNTGSCPNLGQYVFIQRVVVGNASLFSSPFGTPSAGIIGTSGNIASSVT